MIDLHSLMPKKGAFTSLCLYFLMVLPAFLTDRINASSENDDMLLNNAQSAFSRNMVALGSRPTQPSDPIVRRSSFPEANDPHICLAFLSCCDRTDLLNHTLAGVIRHMEEDEPSFLRYEIAWVDNGSDPEKTAVIADSFEIEHALRMPKNMGLAYGMNQLIFNLCKAPYILLLEEDWLYLDDVVAPQSPERKRAIATSIALVENMRYNNVTAFDGRKVMGVFLRHESYDRFLEFPLRDNWESRKKVDLSKELERTKKESSEQEGSCDSERVTSETGSIPVDIDYRIYCGDVTTRMDYIWGSYTNGAGLYRRKDLMQIGRMYGEPGDAFHDRYVEGNYAYRAAMNFCHMALRLTDDRSCESIYDPDCTGAFHHIGGGRGTRPMNAKGTTCDDKAWTFFGTPMYDKFHSYLERKTGQKVHVCSKDDLEQLRQRKFRDLDAEEYRMQVKKTNEKQFEKERAEREALRGQAELVEQLLDTNPERLRAEVDFMADKTDGEIRAMADRIRRLADSPHPLKGYWDSHGRLIDG